MYVKILHASIKVLLIWAILQYLLHNQLESVCSELFQIESLKHLDLSHICLKMLFSV